MWKTGTSNKNWVQYTDLKDDPATMAACIAHDKGPQLTKYCGDGGVYYAYNFVEKDVKGGSVQQPWGADKMQEKLGIDPKVMKTTLNSLGNS